MALLVLCAGAVGCADTHEEPPGYGPETPRISIRGHGTYYDLAGRPVEVTPEIIAASQARWLEAYGSVDDADLSGVDTRVLHDPVVRNAFAILALIKEDRQPSDHAAFDTNAGLLGIHLDEYYAGLADPSEVRAAFTELLVRPSRRPRGPLGSVSSRLETTESQAGYVSQCRIEGVPVPDRVIDPAIGWTNGRNPPTVEGPYIQNVISNNRVLDNVELWWWIPEDDSGACLALPRWTFTSPGVGNTERGFSMICMARSSPTGRPRACFFDERDFPATYTRQNLIICPAPPSGSGCGPNKGLDISAFQGGTTLETYNLMRSAGACPTCHAGENPFVTYPQEEAFAAFHGAFAGTSLAGALPERWHEPIVPAGWAQNPGPLEFPDPDVGDSCGDCHTRGSIAGRLPLVNDPSLWDLRNPTMLLPASAYCNVVLTSAIDGRTAIAGATDFAATMPPDSLWPGVGSDYSESANWIKALCAAGMNNTGTIIPTPMLGTVGLGKPRIVTPIYSCTMSVGVRDVPLDATLSLWRNIPGDGVPEQQVGVDRVVGELGLEVFMLSAPLEAGEHVYARVTRGAAGPVESDHEQREDFMGAIPAPSFVPNVSHRCANRVIVRHVPGATLFIDNLDDSLPDPIEVQGRPISRTYVTYPEAFEVGDRLTVSQTIGCSPPPPVPLAPGEEIVVAMAPTANPPTVMGPVYTGQRFFRVEGLLEGAAVEFSIPAAPPAVPSVVSGGTSSWPQTWMATHIVGGDGIDAGEVLHVEQALCPDNDAVGMAPAPLDCASQLPPAEILPPIEGYKYVVVSERVLGATVTLWLEQVDSSGNVTYEWMAETNYRELRFEEELIAGDTLLVTQALGACVAQNAFLIDVQAASSAP